MKVPVRCQSADLVETTEDGADLTRLGSAQLLLEGGQHVAWECLTTLPDINKLGDLLLLGLRCCLNEISHKGRERIGDLLHARRKCTCSGIP